MNKLSLAVLSDIHLGHNRNSASEIIKNLRCAIPDNAETSQLDIIFLAGDVFDHLLSLPNEDVVEIDIWIASLLRLCKKHDIALRVLEGTPSHDWKQSERFLTINTILKIGTDVKYVKDLSIEYMEKFGIHVLYVPDEWESTTEKTLSQVHDLLRDRNLDKVDLAIMHGQFEYQLPPQIKAQKHSSQAYLDIVRSLIFIGHVHTHSRFERIIAQGSFDRLSHGEEGPKGHVRAVIKTNGESDVTFVENPGAKLFVTVDCTQMSLDETLAEVNRRAGHLPPGAFVRVQADADNPIFSNMELLVRNHPLFTWSKKVNEEKEEVLVIEEDETVYVPITLTKDNLEGLLMERLIAANAPGEMLQAAQEILKEVM